MELEPFLRAAEQGQILPHQVGLESRQIHDLQRVAQTYLEWVDTRLKPTCPSVFLAAGSVSEDGLRTLLREVTQEVFQIAPPQESASAVGCDAAASRDQQALFAVWQVLNGFVLLEEAVLGHYRPGLRRTGQTALERAGLARKPLVSISERDRVVESAVPGLAQERAAAFIRLLTAQYRRKKGASGRGVLVGAEAGRVGTSISRHRVLYEALFRAVEELGDKFITDLLSPVKVHGACGQKELVKVVMDTFSTISRHQNVMRLDEVVEAVGNLRAESETWIAKSLVKQNRGHVVNQRLGKTLRRHVAYVSQYCWLLLGNRYTDDVIDAAIQLRTLCDALSKALLKLPGIAKPSKDANTDALVKCDNTVLRAGLVSHWHATLGERAGLVGKFCKHQARVQKDTWLVQDQLEVFESIRKSVAGTAARGRVSRKPVSDRRRCEAFVEDLLVPMQSVGLAAQVPWDSLWQRLEDPSGELTGHVGKKWVVNPFGLQLAGV
jgi:hypothetical protein